MSRMDKMMNLIPIVLNGARKEKKREREDPFRPTFDPFLLSDCSVRGMKKTFERDEERVRVVDPRREIG